MQKMVEMTMNKCESKNFYKYLSQKIGSEEVVRFRRLSVSFSDMVNSLRYVKITSGSKGEGIDMNGSDLDIMLFDTCFKVYESETDVIRDGRTIPLIMNTEETNPCFAQLRLLNNHPKYPLLSVTFNFNIWQTNYLGCMLSSELYKLYALTLFTLRRNLKLWQVHGPCISDRKEQFDILNCLKCDQWIFQAKPWIYRPRSTWPSPEIISKIISFGVIFVPIGCKGSINESLEWRISFSVAEKFLMFTVNHTQLLCYALLKILLKEIVEKFTDLKGLLCSYFLKTLLFWISEETDPNLWRPDTIIPCFRACLQRLLYCVRYSILSHYFIPDHNLFYSRFEVMNKKKLETILKSLFEQGIHCLASSETLNDYQRQSYIITESLTCENFMRIIQNGEAYFDNANIKKKLLLYHCLHHFRTGLSGSLSVLHLSKAFRFAPDASKYLYSLENKQQYCKYKYDLSHLLIGLHSDAVSGWLTLASFFYVHENYSASISLIDYVLQKNTDEKVFTGLTSSTFIILQLGSTMQRVTTKEYTCIQKHVLNLMKKENPYTVLKALTIEALIFTSRSFMIPQEIQLNSEKEFDLYHPLTFAYFLSFLCYYHLQDNIACRHYLKQLLTNSVFRISIDNIYLSVSSTPIMLDKALRLIGETNLARRISQLIDDNVPRYSGGIEECNTSV